jgi:hypothetical protein
MRLASGGCAAAADELCDLKHAIRCRGGDDPVKYVSVLTPPLLVCAAFLIAVIAFLRHEMGGRRRGSRDLPSEDISDEEPIPHADRDTNGQDHGTSELHDDN